MPYWKLLYHIVWSTKERLPLLTRSAESQVYGFIRGKAVGLGATVFALGGTEDHVHVVAAIPPRIAVARFIGQIKGVASARYNKAHPESPIYWQAEYGAFSFDVKRLPNYVSYVERQKEHHTQRTTIPLLERIEGRGVQLLFREEQEPYAATDSEWWQEMYALGT